MKSVHPSRLLAAGAVLLCTGFGQIAHGAKQTPQQRTEALINAFIQVKAEPEDGSPLSAADKKANEKAFAALDDFFDFDTLIDKTIKPHLKKFKPEQLKAFRTNFKKVIRLVAYPDSGAFLQEAQRTIGKTSRKGKKASVKLVVELEEEDLEMDVVFYFEDQGEWRLVDVAFDGAKLTKDYQNQFGRIINSGGVDSLVDKLNKRLAKELEE